MIWAILFVGFMIMGLWEYGPHVKLNLLVAWLCKIGGLVSLIGALIDALDL